MGKHIIIIGAGPAGLIAGLSAAQNGAQVTLLEKMAAPGRKLLITGSGRCNITNSADIETFIQKCNNGRFLYPAFNEFFRNDLLELFYRFNMKFVTEENGKIFPDQSNASDILAKLISLNTQAGVKILTDFSVKKVHRESNCFCAVSSQNQTISGDALIIATGGSSYPNTGSAGDGFFLAQSLGHQIIPVKPALVPLLSNESWIKDLQGISVEDVELQLFVNKKRIKRDKGALLFTHFGLSGPLILRISRHLPYNKETDKLNAECMLKINLCPQFSVSELAEKWAADIKAASNQNLINALSGPLPSRLQEVLIILANLDPKSRSGAINSDQLINLAKITTGLPVNIYGSRGFKTAMVTAGGINLKQIDPKSMESKIIKDLFFAGEVIDIDADTGGYNLQAAFSTGWLAGKNAAKFRI